MVFQEHPGSQRARIIQVRIFSFSLWTHCIRTIVVMGSERPYMEIEEMAIRDQWSTFLGT